ncbi:MAG: AMP-binding protein [Deltaproteobacteria bacterium]|nr:AMP-binding protein [Deltaproteobacteria bacterium]
MTGDTLPKLLQEQAENSGCRRPALREKEYGLWRSFTWQEYYEHVKNFCLGMVALGLKKGDRIAIIGDNRPEWIYAELAAQCVGALPVGIYQEAVAEEVFTILDLARAKLVVVEDLEQCDKIFSLLERLPAVAYVIYHDPKGMSFYADPRLRFFPEVEALGRRYAEARPDFFALLIAATREDDGAVLCPTAGTTGGGDEKPRLALLSHGNMVQMARSLGEVDKKLAGSEFVSCLPLAWVGEQMMAVVCALLFGFTVNFPEKQESAHENVREIGPHLMFAPPRVWENLAALVQVKIKSATPGKRFVYEHCLPVGYSWADLRLQKKKPSFWEKLMYGLAFRLVFRSLQDRIGLSRLRCAYTGGGALGADTFRFFHALGVNLKQLYGLTETAGFSCAHWEGDVDSASVGKPLPGTEIKISAAGEILVRTPVLFPGYYNDKAAAGTSRDGWLHSGDAGYFNDRGHLVVVDRLHDFIMLPDGTRIAPQFIENKLKFSPYIKEAVVIGAGREYLAALISVDFETVGQWAASRRLAFTDYADLVAVPAVCEMIKDEVVGLNQSLPASLGKFILLHKELEPDDGELTWTRKVRRGHVNEKYRAMIKAMYAGFEIIDTEMMVEYQDGRSHSKSIAVKVITL